MNELTDPSWVTAFAALSLLEKKLGGAVSAKAELADRLRDGRLRSKAEVKWISVETSLWDAWNEPDSDDEDAELAHEFEIEPWVWRWSDRWITDQMNWRWPSGRFSLTHQVEPIQRFMLHGVHFDTAEIASLAGISVVDALSGQAIAPIDGIDHSPKKERGGNRRGPKPRVDAYINAYNELFQMEIDGILRGVASLDELLEELEDRKVGLKADALRPYVSRFWERFVRSRWPEK